MLLILELIIFPKKQIESTYSEVLFKLERRYQKVTNKYVVPIKIMVLPHILDTTGDTEILDKRLIHHPL